MKHRIIESKKRTPLETLRVNWKGKHCYIF